MISYSTKLTLYSLSVIPLFILLTIFVSPIIKKQLRKQAEANAKVNSHLVETISGIETVKGQVIEMQSEWRWEKLYEKQVKANFLNIITRWLCGCLLKEESPDSSEYQSRITSGGGNPRESATENKPPIFYLVRVKRWGKSPPHFW